jgi:hypothetical protein
MARVRLGLGLELELALASGTSCVFLHIDETIPTRILFLNLILTFTRNPNPNRLRKRIDELKQFQTFQLVPFDAIFRRQYLDSERRFTNLGFGFGVGFQLGVGFG